MTNKNLSEVTKKLLHDPEFIIWCMVPTKEADARWLRWQEEHPDKRGAVEQARRILRSARLNDYAIPRGESQALFARIEKSANQNRQEKRLYLFRYVAACAVVLLAMAGSWLLWGPVSSSDALIAHSVIGADSTCTEVTLIMDNSEAVQVEDNALITYDSDVTVKNQRDEQTVLKKTNKDRDKEVMNTLVVPRGRRSSLVLADGSKVWVNSGSELRFPTIFDQQERVIEAKGEIYIEVVKNASPFYVKANGFTVKVLGTKFNISAYSDEESHSVVLVEGSVLVDTEDHEAIHLSPNQMLTMADGKNNVEEVDVNNYISWKDGVLQFRDESMGYIFQRLGRYYNIPVKYTPAIAGRRSSGKLVLFDNMEQVIKTFSMLYDISYRMEGDTMLIE